MIRCKSTIILLCTQVCTREILSKKILPNSYRKPFTNFYQLNNYFFSTCIHLICQYFTLQLVQIITHLPSRVLLFQIFPTYGTYVPSWFQYSLCRNSIAKFNYSFFLYALSLGSKRCMSYKTLTDDQYMCHRHMAIIIVINIHSRQSAFPWSFGHFWFLLKCYSIIIISCYA